MDSRQLTISVLGVRFPTVLQTPSLDIGARAVNGTDKVMWVPFKHCKTGKLFVDGKIDFTLLYKQKYCHTGLTEEKKIKFKISKNLVFLLELINMLDLMFAHKLSIICLIHIILPFMKT